MYLLLWMLPIIGQKKLFDVLIVLWCFQHKERSYLTLGEDTLIFCSIFKVLKRSKLFNLWKNLNAEMTAERSESYPPTFYFLQVPPLSDYTHTSLGSISPAEFF